MHATCAACTVHDLHVETNETHLRFACRRPACQRGHDFNNRPTTGTKNLKKAHLDSTMWIIWLAELSTQKMTSFICPLGILSFLLLKIGKVESRSASHLFYITMRLLISISWDLCVWVSVLLRRFCRFCSCQGAAVMTFFGKAPFSLRVPLVVFSKKGL